MRSGDSTTRVADSGGVGGDKARGSAEAIEPGGVNDWGTDDPHLLGEYQLAESFTVDKVNVRRG